MGRGTQEARCPPSQQVRVPEWGLVVEGSWIDVRGLDRTGVAGCGWSACLGVPDKVHGVPSMGSNMG